MHKLDEGKKHDIKEIVRVLNEVIDRLNEHESVRHKKQINPL